MFVIGLTGGIASGKSTVAKVLSDLGLTVIDADQLAREVVTPCAPAYEKLVATFGSSILNNDGTIHRKKLGDMVFADPSVRQRLNDITHPAIRKLAIERIDEARLSGARCVVYMAPLLLEAGGDALVDVIWVVYTDRHTQIARLMGRDHLTQKEAEQRVDSQMSLDRKRSLADVTIDNGGTREHTEMQVLKEWRMLESRLS